jgi:chaperone required for assembly of F1-ATPase
MKRFWEKAEIAAEEGGFRVTLDGRPMNLPGGVRLRLPNRALAEAVAAEWQAAGGGKGGEFSFDDVPLSRLAGTAQERIAPDPAPTAFALSEYGASDLLCYRAEAPEPLVERQTREWQPWLDWAMRNYDARLRVTSGVMPVKQDPLALQALRRALLGMDPWVLAGLGIAVPALGSLVLGLAVASGELDAEAAYELATLDERSQEELWGADEEAVRRRQRIAADVALAARFMALSRAA